jgi:hypothetical protein
VSFCFDFRSAVKGHPWGLTRLVDSVISLRNVLETLRNLAEEAEGESENVGRSRLPALQQLCGQGGPLEKCLQELNGIEKKLFSTKWSGEIETDPEGVDKIVWVEAEE